MKIKVLAISGALVIALMLPAFTSAGHFHTEAQKECAIRQANKPPHWRTPKCVAFVYNMTIAVMQDLYGSKLIAKPVLYEFLSEDESRGIRKFAGGGLHGWTTGDLHVYILAPTALANFPTELVLAHEFTHTLEYANSLGHPGDANSEMQARDVATEVYSYLFPGA